MFRHLAAAFAVLAAFAFTVPTADAGQRHHRHHHKVDKRVVATGVVVGAAATASYFALNDWRWEWNSGSQISSGGALALTTVGCAALSPMVATAVVNRPLTTREAHVLVGSCVVPVVGGLLVNAVWNANPHWEAKPVVAKRPRAKAKARAKK